VTLLRCESAPSNGALNLTIGAVVRGLELIAWCGCVFLHRERTALAPLAGWLIDV
jgi:hypothetical protein